MLFVVGIQFLLMQCFFFAYAGLFSSRRLGIVVISLLAGFAGLLSFIVVILCIILIKKSKKKPVLQVPLDPTHSNAPVNSSYGSTSERTSWLIRGFSRTIHWYWYNVYCYSSQVNNSYFASILLPLYIHHYKNECVI